MAAPKLEDDEAFWATSVASTRTSRGQNVFDESVDLEATRRILHGMSTIDDTADESDVINWDGSSNASSKVEFISARYRPQYAGSTVSAKTTPNTVAQKRPSFDTSSLNQSKLASGTIEDVVSAGGTTPRKQPTLTEISRLESEINFLKRNIESSKRVKEEKIHPRDMVRRMILGQWYSFELYKSKEDKLQLLDEAITSHDGNSIIAAVLFLRDTIKVPIFNLELTLRPIAAQHYLNHLRQHNDNEKLLDLLGMLKMTEEAAMLKYKQAVSGQQTQSKLKSLKNCYQTHFQTEPSLSHDASLVNEQIQLLERQLPVEESDMQAAERGAVIFRELPRQASILDTSVITTLFYCCLYHYELTDNNLSSPHGIRKAHRLTDKQYMWPAISARAKLRRWNDIEALFQTKGWLGGMKMKAPVGFERIVPHLYRLNTPREILNKYCNLVENLDVRLELGQKFNCHESVIETYMAMKDRLQLIGYQSKVKVNSPEWFYANDVLRNSSIKWKN